MPISLSDFFKVEDDLFYKWGLTIGRRRGPRATKRAIAADMKKKGIDVKTIAMVLNDDFYRMGLRTGKKEAIDELKEIATRMKNGAIPIDKIVKWTKLSMKQVENL